MGTLRSYFYVRSRVSPSTKAEMRISPVEYVFGLFLYPYLKSSCSGVSCQLFCLRVTNLSK